MKAHSISGKGLKKDFFDLWTLIKIHGWKLQDMINMLKVKYKTHNTLIFIKALMYFEDAERNRESEVVEKKWNEIKRYFISYVKEYINSLEE